MSTQKELDIEASDSWASYIIISAVLNIFVSYVHFLFIRDLITRMYTRAFRLKKLTMKLKGSILMTLSILSYQISLWNFNGLHYPDLSIFGIFSDFSLIFIEQYV